MTTFAIRLKTAMDQAHINQSALSTATGIGKPSISQYLSGKNEPQKNNMEKIVTATGVSLDFLMGYDVPATISSVSVDRISTRIAARCIGKSENFIRVGLQRGILPFGNAVPGTGKKFIYYINPGQFRDYVGGDHFDKFFGVVG